MKASILVLVLLLSTSLIFGQEAENYVTVDGQQVWVKSSGLEDRKFGQPLVILHSSPGDPMDRFSKVFEQVSTYSPVLAYDGVGMDKSDPAGQSTPPDAGVAELRDLLSALNLAPPYVLVSNNWGAVSAQEFARTYPEEVLGLLYLDPVSPSEDLSFSVAQLNINGREGELTAAEYLNLQSLMLLSGNTQRSAAEIELLKSKLENPDFYSQPDPDGEIPTIFMFGKVKQTMVFEDSLYLVGKELLEQRLQDRVDFFQDLTAKQTKSTLLLSADAANYLPLQSAVAVSLQVQQLLYSDPLRRIWTASRTMNSSDFERFMDGLRAYVPEFLLSERDLNMIGYSMMRADLYQHALVIFADNLKNHPNSANAYDSYGDGLFALGRVEESLSAFRKAVELGEKENHSDLGLFIKNLKKTEEIVSN
ncbi:alpha/beta fold hydrolase [Algoriphagus namhaensis]